MSEIVATDDVLGGAPRLASIDHPLSDVMNANSSPVDPWRTTENIIGCDDFIHYLPIHGSG